jgi:hypothetical protein
MLQDKRKAEEERLLAALSGNLGFHKGRPLAAIIVFRCCLQWRAYQVGSWHCATGIRWHNNYGFGCPCTCCELSLAPPLPGRPHVAV